MFNIISNSEKEFLLNYLKQDKRIDNRSIEDYRNIKLTKLDENGQIETKLGNTLVISQIFAKLIAPNKERPSEGVIVFSVDSNALRPSAEFHQANEDLNELRNKLGNLLDKSLRETK
jgi:exosome complex component RRP45